MLLYKGRTMYMQVRNLKWQVIYIVNISVDCFLSDVVVSLATISSKEISTEFFTINKHYMEFFTINKYYISCDSP